MLSLLTVYFVLLEHESIYFPKREKRQMISNRMKMKQTFLVPIVFRVSVNDVDASS